MMNLALTHDSLNISRYSFRNVYPIVLRNLNLIINYNIQ